MLSGRDVRHAGRAFANQIIMGFWGGGAVYGHDGWLTAGSPGAAGVLNQASVEVVEQQQPIIVERLEIGIDFRRAGPMGRGAGRLLHLQSKAGRRAFHDECGRQGFSAAGGRRRQAGRRNGIWRLDRDGRKTGGSILSRHDPFRRANAWSPWHAAAAATAIRSIAIRQPSLTGCGKDGFRRNAPVTTMA